MTMSGSDFEVRVIDALSEVLSDGVPDELMPGLVDAAREWLDRRERRSPACQRADAASMARCIAEMPGMYRHWIGNDDKILTRKGATGYRMQDLIPEAELGRYREWVDGEA